ncbi:hypothetical protein MRB53_013334 [Persea americana]|uniref:Uncharacterized protein n=1 Tax=Persea americana TaxID=3435 RepID=A0ACC2K805_PERAE|nr:hypothetical protein MRB53_013334 [Persea americana]
MIEGKCSDLKSEAEHPPGEDKKLKEEVNVWLRQAQNMIDEIDSIKTEFDQRRTLTLLSRYKLGRRIAKKLKDVRVHSEKGRALPKELFSSIPRKKEASAIRPATTQASFIKTMNEVLGHLDDERKSTICVYGMGGIGKTHLMNAIEKELKVTKKFKVIRVTASKNFNHERFQMEIMKILGIYMANQHVTYNMKSEKLSEIWSNSRYVLIIDDLWQKIDLGNIGIPAYKDNGPKIAITTRLFDVCRDMSADAKIRMQTLTKQEARELFDANVGEADGEPHIQDIAANIVEECGGMPLAIITVARAMREKTQKELWENTLTLLKASAAHEIRGMETEVFERLKPSYDELKDHKVKMCFLYCSLFPKQEKGDEIFPKEENGDEICVNDLVNIWTIEGFIDKAHNLVEASNIGHGIVDSLKDKCLLEGGTKHHNNVKMHHVIRSFAVWITSLPSHEGGPKSKFLVKAGKGLKEPPLEETEDIERISLMSNDIKKLSSGPNCRNLVSLFLRKNPITYVSPSFFELMPRLKILDLSATNIESLMISPSSLPMLRALILKNCGSLRELKFLGQLKELVILDLSYSSMITLPCEMQNLHKLKRLDLSYIDAGLIIPPNIICGLSSLVDMRLMMTKVMWAKQSEPEAATNATYGEVAKLKDLISLEIYIHNINCVEEHVPHWPWSKLERFKINIGQFPLNVDLPCARQMQIEGGKHYPHGLKVIAARTEGLGLHEVHGELVSQLVGDLKGLEGLKILFFRSCRELECIVDCRHVGENAMENIEHLNLYMLPKLKKLFEQVSKVCLKKLRKIVVQRCDALKSLFSSEMVADLGALEYLDVRNCAELEEIIEGEIEKSSTQGDSKTRKESRIGEFRGKKEERTKGDLQDERSTEGDASAKNSKTEGPLQSLRSLKLSELPKLKRIIRLHTLGLPRLEHYHQFKCPNLSVPNCPNITGRNPRPSPQI